MSGANDRTFHYGARAIALMSLLALLGCGGPASPTSAVSPEPPSPLEAGVTCTASEGGTYRLHATLRAADPRPDAVHIVPTGLPYPVSTPDPQRDLVIGVVLGTDELDLTLVRLPGPDEPATLRLTLSFTALSEVELEAPNLETLQGSVGSSPLGTVQVKAARRDGPLVGLALMVRAAPLSGASLQGLSGIELRLGGLRYVGSVSE